MMAKNIKTDEVDEIPVEKMHGCGSETTRLYKVEYCSTYGDPMTIGEGLGKFVIDQKWRQLSIGESKSLSGVNIPCSKWDRKYLGHGLVSRDVAEAHRYAFIAWLNSGDIGSLGSLCIHTRLVQVELRTTYNTKEIGVTEALSAFRRNNKDEFLDRDDRVDEVLDN